MASYGHRDEEIFQIYHLFVVITSYIMTEAETKRMRWTFDDPCTVMEVTRDSRSLPKILLEIEPPATDVSIAFAFFDPDGGLQGNTLDFLPSEVQEELIRMVSDDPQLFQAVGAKTATLRTLPKGEGDTGHRYALVSLGKASIPANDTIDPKAGSAIASVCIEEKTCSTCTVFLPKAIEDLSSVATSFSTSLYSDNRYRTGDNQKIPAENLSTVYFCHSELGPANSDSIDRGLKFADGQALAMDIVNAPHNVLNSVSLANLAMRLARESTSGLLTCSILDKKDCESLGMGAYLAVARGSETEPQFIHMTYKSDGPIIRKVGVVGKGLLFDTGGYNIKTQMMELMKFDCGGAAAALGAAKAIDALAPAGVEVHFIVAACENMISAKAYVPSDVITASNGKTIEVVNTDAEGRLTLADALVYADKTIGCEKIIELSTLTGACIISLGKKICGVWSDNEEMAQELESISKATGEKCWRMPMEKEYSEEIESAIADLKNCGTNRWGGAIHAALFLQHFVNPQTPFAHIDIAGPVWNDKKKAATGFGVKLVTEWVTRQGQD